MKKKYMQVKEMADCLFPDNWCNRRWRRGLIIVWSPDFSMSKRKANSLKPHPKIQWLEGFHLP